MEELWVKNTLNLKVFINGVPDITLVPEEVEEEFISFLLLLLE